MSRILATLTGEGFIARIIEGDDTIVRFKADADIDADGANGQHGKQAAYTVRNDGSEHLANGGMGIRNGKVVFTQSWGPDIAVVDDEGDPLVINGVVVTKTAYRFKHLDPSDPKAYVDSETVPYIVVPPVIIRGVVGIVKGCLAVARYRDKSVVGVVADVGPRSKCGEISIEAARRLGIPPSPRTGGINTPDVEYEIHPGVEAEVDGVTYELQRS